MIVATSLSGIWAGAVRSLHADAQILDGGRVLSELRRESHHDREMPVAAGLIDVAGGIAADRHPDGGVDVARRETVARRAGAIDVDLHGRLAERGEHRKIGDAGHGGEHGLDLVGGVGQRLQIVAEQLDRVLAFDARDRLGDVVLQILREVEFDAGKIGLELAEDLRGERVLVHARAAIGSTGFRGAKNSALKKPAASVPSSGRPCCETTVSTSGKRRIASRMRLT